MSSSEFGSGKDSGKELGVVTNKMSHGGRRYNEGNSEEIEK